MRKVNAQDVKDMLDGMDSKGYDLSKLEFWVRESIFNPEKLVWGFHVDKEKVVLEV